MPVRISALAAATALDEDDVLPVVEDGTTVKATTVQVVAGAKSATSLAATTLAPGFMSADDWDILREQARGVPLIEHFTHGNGRSSSSVSGAGAVVSQRASEAGRPGIQRGATGTATGRAWIGFGFAGTGSHIMTDGTTYYASLMRVAALSTATEEYDCFSGLFDILTARPTNGIYFRYDRDGVGLNWLLESANGGVYTTVDTGVPVAASAAAMTLLEIRGNAAGTSFQAYINGSAVGSAITTNIPSSIAGTGPGVNMVKSATAGVASTFDIDKLVLFKGIGV